MSWANAASSVHVEDSGAAAAWRPGQNTRVRLEVKVSAIFSGEVQGIVHALRVASKGESVGAFALGTVRYLGEANHVRVEDGEPRFLSV